MSRGLCLQSETPITYSVIGVLRKGRNTLWVYWELKGNIRHERKKTQNSEPSHTRIFPADVFCVVSGIGAGDWITIIAGAAGSFWGLYLVRPAKRSEIVELWKSKWSAKTE